MQAWNEVLYDQNNKHYHKNDDILSIWKSFWLVRIKIRFFDPLDQRSSAFYSSIHFLIWLYDIISFLLLKWLSGENDKLVKFVV